MPTRSAEWGEAGGYEQETIWDQCTVAALGVPYERAQWRKVTTLSGGEQKRLVLEACCVARRRCCCSTSRTTTSTCRRSAGWRTRSSRRPRRCCSSAMIASCSTASPPASPPSSRVPWARRSGCTRGISRHTPRPARTATPGSRSCGGAGTRSTSSSRPGADPQGQGDVQRRDGLAVPGRPDPPGEVRRGRARRRRSRCTRTSGCASPEDGPPSVRSSRRTSS